MSNATGLLLAGAIGIMLVMHLVGHGGHGSSHGAHEAQGAKSASTPDRGDGANVLKSAAPTVSGRRQGSRGPLRGRDFMLDDLTSGADRDGH